MNQKIGIKDELASRNALRLVRCIYGLSPSSVDVLWTLISSERPMIANEIAQHLQMPKVSISLSLKRLYEFGLIERRHRRDNGVKRGKGRFQFEYYVDKLRFMQKLWNDMESKYREMYTSDF
ncbi:MULTISPECIES: MarR family transcriptional regulator [Metallosphaera]|nr:MarR family transcriptional regulator [Metallosphaera cuprina]